MKYTILLTLAVFLFPIFSLEASELSVSASTRELQANGQFAIDVMLDTEERSINAIAGSVTFDHELMSLASIWDGNSIVPLWLEQPAESDAGSISFRGVIPGGFSGSDGQLFTIIFDTDQEGSSVITFHNFILYTNQRQPEEIQVPDVTLPIKITDQDEAGFSVVVEDDTTPPDSFVPEIAHGPDMFDGQYFIIFNTVDDSSGISHYEILERDERLSRTKRQNTTGDELPWEKVRSPVVLSDQALSQYVYIKAVDKAGNSRIAEVFPQTSTVQKKGESSKIPGIIVIVSAILILLILWIKKKRSTHHDDH